MLLIPSSSPSLSSFPSRCRYGHDPEMIPLIANRTLEQLGLSRIADELIGTNGVVKLSGGEQRRLSIALALVSGPAILFLDEPLSGLDSSTAYTTVAWLKRIAEVHQCCGTSPEDDGP